MWALRKKVWNEIAVRKFRANKPVETPVPEDDPKPPLRAVSLVSQFPDIQVANVLVADRVPDDEASTLDYYFYEVQVGLYGALSPMEDGLPSIDPDPAAALDEAYTDTHRACFPAPVLPPEYQGTIDLGSLAVAGPYACYLEAAAEGGYQWDLRRLDSYERHPGLVSPGVRVHFRVDEPGRRLQADRIECALGACAPGDAGWSQAVKLALCAATTHVSLVRHFNWVHLAAGGPFAIATRNCLPAAHPLRRMLWPHMFRTQYSNQLVTKGQMAPGGDFESIFSFTHAGVCRLFEDSYREFDISVLAPPRDARRRAIADAGFATPTLDNRRAHFDVFLAHATRYLGVYYTSDAALAADTAVTAWVAALDEMMPGGVRSITGSTLTIAGVAELCAALVYMATVEHEVLGTGLWNYQMWTHVQPVRVYADGRREPLDVYQRLVNANFNLNVRRAQLMQDFGYLALDDRGKSAFRQFREDLAALQARVDGEPRAHWMVSPGILEASINA
jgi:hypothetical protein